MPHQDPLPLYEVLEEEYVSLHGPLPDGYYQNNKTPDERLKAIYKLIHDLPKQRSALCISGGGIRSATFALGVVQGLARCRVIDKFDYLSTVSGGGYVGGWFSAWINRASKGRQEVFQKLNGESSSPLEPEAAPVSHLRSYSNYLSPKLGLLSADTWTLVATVGRNLILNWLVLIPLLLAALFVPRLSVSVIRWHPPDWVLWITPAVSFLLVVVALVYVGLYRPSLKERRSERLESCEGQGWFLLWCLLPLVVSAILFTTFWAWLPRLGIDLEDSPVVSDVGSLASFVIFGTVIYFLAWAIYSIWLKVFNYRELVVILLVGALGGVLLYVIKKVFPNPGGEGSTFLTAEHYVCFAMPLALTLFLLSTVFFVGLASRFTDDEDREWMARFGAWALIVIVGWSVTSYIVIFGPYWLLYLEGEMQAVVASVGGVSGLITILLGRSRDTDGAKEDGKNKSGVKNIALQVAAPVFAVFIIVALSFGTSGLIILAERFFDRIGIDLSAIAADAHLGDHFNIVRESPVWLVIALMALMLLIGIVMAWFININKFSLHAMYRNRLIRAYLGASREKRSENRFTGFDPDDNVQMHELRPQLFNRGSFTSPRSLYEKLSDPTNPVSQYLMGRLSSEAKDQLEKYDPSNIDTTLDLFISEVNELLDGPSLYDEKRFEGVELNEETRASVAQNPAGARLVTLNRLLLEQAYAGEITSFRSYKPLHVVNMALNLVKGDNLAWQQRKAESFTASALHSGSYTVGDECGSYRRSKEYGNAPKYDGVYGISLGTAVAISGAAVSPNMGYHSSSVVTFLLTLFNARLGWWLGNPGLPGQAVYSRPSPFFAIGPMIAEAFGLTDDKKRYVYLSDGGHFENLALYEMVLRRCRFIVVLDASQDPARALGDLGGAIRKIRIDFGIPIDFHEGFSIFPRSEDELPNEKGKYCAVATIHYSCVDGEGTDGTLVYIKPAVYGKEPSDVLSYAEESKMFPHETTGDQFFSESQFESYRMLGSHVMNSICGEGERGGDMSQDEFLKMVYTYLGEPVPQELEHKIQAAGGASNTVSPPDEIG
ncbi:MAG: patatin-like phospholipase family protein [Blastocatellia bacterium]|nr:patatin-like phospholipase family protein [Blastocatellia bacterium]